MEINVQMELNPGDKLVCNKKLWENYGERGQCDETKTISSRNYAMVVHRFHVSYISSELHGKW